MSDCLARNRGNNAVENGIDPPLATPVRRYYELRGWASPEEYC
jgi:hypothetical protein